MFVFNAFDLIQLEDLVVQPYLLLVYETVIWWENMLTKVVLLCELSNELVLFLVEVYVQLLLNFAWAHDLHVVADLLS